MSLKSLVHLVCFSLLLGLVNAANNFAGITVSNSASAWSYTCRTQAQWNTLAQTAKSQGFNSIRILGFDCDALTRAASAAESQGMTILAGIWVSGTMASSATHIANEVEVFRAAHTRFGAWRFKGLTIGNEVNDSGVNIINKVYDVRGYLRSIGINTPVSTVHHWPFIQSNPVLCNGDFVGANAHGYFDWNTTPGKAGDHVFLTAVPAMRSTCPGKPIWITESGWPSRGPSNGRATASWDSARTALLNLNCACMTDRSVHVYAFEGDDSLWKWGDTERSFGIFGKYNLLGDVFAPC